MNKKILLFLISMVSFVSCSDKSGAEFEVSLEGQFVKMDINKGLWPKWMLGDNIYALDQNWSIYSGKMTRTEWQKAEKILVKGHGQNEFGCMDLSQDNHGAIYVIDHPEIDETAFEATLATLTKIPHPDNHSTFKDPTKWERYDLRQMPRFYQGGTTFVVLSDSTLLLIGAPEDDLHHVFATVNFKNQTVTPLDYWPNDSTPEVLTEEKWAVYTEGGVADNGKGRFLYWGDSGKLAFIFTIDGNKTNILNYIYSDHLPIPVIAKTPSTEHIHCCADNDRIYLLYKHSNSKGEVMEEFDMKDPFPWGNTVEVYDWDGVKQHIIHLDKFGQEIMLSKDGKTLYLYSGFIDDETDPYIYSYDLSSLY